MNRSRLFKLAGLAVVVLAIVAGCLTASRAVNVAAIGSAKDVQVYEGGRPVFERVVTPESAEERAIASWLKSHQDGWRPTVVTYAPVRRIRGDDFDLNFVGGQCVMNYRTNDEGAWTQVSRPIRDGDPILEVFARSR